MMEYRLAETVVRISGTFSWVEDDYALAADVPELTADASVVVTTCADLDTTRSLAPSGGGQDLSIGLTADGRLTSVAHASVGAGGKIVTAGATVGAFVAGLVLSGGNPLVAGAAAGAAAHALSADRAATGTTPEERAQAAWEKDHRTEHDLMVTYRTLIGTVSAALADRRCAAAAAAAPAERRNLVTDAVLLERVLDDSRRALCELDALYGVWRASTRRTRCTNVTYDLTSDADLLARPRVDEPDRVDPPAPPSLTRWRSNTAREVFEAFGIVVELQPLAPVSPGHAPVDGATVQWRVPRPARLWVWRRTSARSEDLHLADVLPIDLLDSSCALRSLPLDKVFFGSRSTELTFDENGQPTRLARNATSGAAEFADALTGLPEGISGGLSTALAVRTSAADLHDLEAARAHAHLIREVEATQKRLDVAGLEATSEQHAELARLEQQVKLRTATQALAPPEPPGETARVLAEIERLRARHDLVLASQGTFRDGGSPSTSG